MAIFGDTGPCASAIELARGVDVMVHGTTLDSSTAGKSQQPRSQLDPTRPAQLALEAGVGRPIMTHVSSRYDEKGCQRLLEECKAIFPDV